MPVPVWIFEASRVVFTGVETFKYPSVTYVKTDEMTVLPEESFR